MHNCIGLNDGIVESTFISIGGTDNHENVIEYFHDDFFQNYNLAVVVLYHFGEDHVASVTKSGSNATITVATRDYYTWDVPETANIYLEYIVLDKDISNVNFDIYNTTVDHYDHDDYELMFYYGIIFSTDIIIIVLLIIKNRSKNNKKITKILISVIITILILLTIFFAYVVYFFITVSLRRLLNQSYIYTQQKKQKLQ